MAELSEQSTRLALSRSLPSPTPATQSPFEARPRAEPDCWKMTKPPTPRAMTSTTAVRTILIVLGFLVVGVGVP